MTINNPVKLRYTINNSDLNVVGEQLGYDWNTICDEIDKHELHGQDGDGLVSISKDTIDVLKEYYGDMLSHILFSIFEKNPNMTKLFIIDNF